MFFALQVLDSLDGQPSFKVREKEADHEEFS
jgi:hypothetical protein